MGRKCGSNIVERVSPSSLLLLNQEKTRSLSSVSLPGVCARAKTEDGGFKRCVDHQSRARSSDRRRGGSFFRSNRVRARARKEGRKEMPSPIETSSEPHLSRRRTKRRRESKTLQKKVRERAPQKQYYCDDRRTSFSFSFSLGRKVRASFFFFFFFKSARASENRHADVQRC